LVTSFTEILLISTIIQVVYWVYFFKKLANYNPNTPQEHDFPQLSILICVKNDLSNIKTNLNTWLSQRLDHKEILIVDDFSGIELKQFIDKMKLKKGSLSYCKVKTNLPGKKQAIKEGLSFSRYNWILHTDADCHPVSNNWAAHMLSASDQGDKSIILGYSPYSVPQKSFLFFWIHFEAWLTGLLYLSFALRGLPYMGVGRNLLYNKTTISDEALSKNTDIASGDDDLLISQISHAKNTSICIHPDSFCYSIPKASWTSYFKQKLRHYSTASRYKFKHQFLLSLFSLSQIVFFISLCLSFVIGDWILATIFYSIRLVIILPIALKVISKLRAEFTIIHFVFFDLVLAVYYLVFSFSFLLPKPKSWQ